MCRNVITVYNLLHFRLHIWLTTLLRRFCQIKKVGDLLIAYPSASMNRNVLLLIEFVEKIQLTETNKRKTLD